MGLVKLISEDNNNNLGGFCISSFDQISTLLASSEYKCATGTAIIKPTGWLLRLDLSQDNNNNNNSKAATTSLTKILLPPCLLLLAIKYYQRLLIQ